VERLLRATRGVVQVELVLPRGGVARRNGQAVGLGCLRKADKNGRSGLDSAPWARPNPEDRIHRAPKVRSVARGMGCSVGGVAAPLEDTAAAEGLKADATQPLVNRRRRRLLGRPEGAARGDVVVGVGRGSARQEPADPPQEATDKRPRAVGGSVGTSAEAGAPGREGSHALRTCRDEPGMAARDKYGHAWAAARTE